VAITCVPAEDAFLGETLADAHAIGTDKHSNAVIVSRETLIHQVEWISDFAFMAATYFLWDRFVMRLPFSYITPLLILR
jgi:hypothetical protein